MGYISMLMFKLCLLQTDHLQGWSAGLLDTVYSHPNPKPKSEKKRKSRKGREPEWRIKKLERLQNWTVYLVYSSLLCKLHLFHFMWLTRNVWARTEYPWKHLISRPTAGMTVGVENNLEILASCICCVHMYALVSSDLGLPISPCSSCAAVSLQGYILALLFELRYTQTLLPLAEFSHLYLCLPTRQRRQSACHICLQPKTPCP